MSCGYNVSAQELHKIAQTGRSLEMPENSKVAIIAADDLSFGITRMCCVFRKDTRSQHQIFGNKDEAIDWLNEP